jgi:hypothetical protein
MRMTEKVHAIFDSHDEAIAALAELERAGVPRSEITLMSSEPVHAETSEHESRIGLFAIAGGLTGAAAAVALTVLTSRGVGLATGGMPIVSPWPFGIIVFELTMLGAILGTLGRMLYEARLLRRNSPVDYGEAIADGRVVLAVECADQSHLDKARSLLSP